MFLVIAIYGWARRRRRLVFAGLAGLFFIAWPPAAWLVLQPLEHGYPRSAPAVADARAIVVLSSGVLASGDGRPRPLVGGDTFERCVCAAGFYLRGQALPILASGGSNADVATPAAVLMREALVAMGVPDSIVWIEDRSRSTYENALYSAEILRQKGIRRIVLVTEAYHMPRAERCFRRQGLSVIPAPCGAHTLHWELGTFLPDGGSVLDSERALHEYIGLAWYGLHGRI